MGMIFHISRRHLSKVQTFFSLSLSPYFPSKSVKIHISILISSKYNVYVDESEFGVWVLLE